MELTTKLLTNAIMCANIHTMDVKDLRVKLDLTQEEFAHRLGVATLTIRRWESKKCRPSRLALRELLKLQRETND